MILNNNNNNNINWDHYLTCRLPLQVKKNLPQRLIILLQHNKLTARLKQNEAGQGRSTDFGRAQHLHVFFYCAAIPSPFPTLFVRYKGNIGTALWKRRKKLSARLSDSSPYFSPGLLGIGGWSEEALLLSVLCGVTRGVACLFSSSSSSSSSSSADVIDPTRKKVGGGMGRREHERGRGEKGKAFESSTRWKMWKYCKIQSTL